MEDKEQARIVKKIKMIEHLDLDESQSTQLFTREKDLDKKIHHINRKKIDLKQRMKELRNSKDATEGKVDKLIEEMHNLDRERKQLKEKHQKNVSDILTPKQRLKYVNFDDHFKKEMKDKLRKGKKHKKRKKEPKR